MCITLTCRWKKAKDKQFKPIYTQWINDWKSQQTGYTIILVCSSVLHVLTNLRQLDGYKLSVSSSLWGLCLEGWCVCSQTTHEVCHGIGESLFQYILGDPTLQICVQQPLEETFSWCILCRLKHPAAGTIVSSEIISNILPILLILKKQRQKNIYIHK